MCVSVSQPRADEGVLGEPTWVEHPDSSMPRCRKHYCAGSRGMVSHRDYTCGPQSQLEDGTQTVGMIHFTFPSNSSSWGCDATGSSNGWPREGNRVANCYSGILLKRYWRSGQLGVRWPHFPLAIMSELACSSCWLRIYEREFSLV
eukprot:jgi/Botrbrau1/6894/Bobra.67_3s0013.1